MAGNKRSECPCDICRSPPHSLTRYWVRGDASAAKSQHPEFVQLPALANSLVTWCYESLVCRLVGYWYAAQVSRLRSQRLVLSRGVLLFGPRPAFSKMCLLLFTRSLGFGLMTIDVGFFVASRSSSSPFSPPDWCDSATILAYVRSRIWGVYYSTKPRYIIILDGVVVSCFLRVRKEISPLSGRICRGELGVRATENFQSTPENYIISYPPW